MRIQLLVLHGRLEYTSAFKHERSTIQTIESISNATNHHIRYEVLRAEGSQDN